MMTSWSDHPATPGTPIKAGHVNELRAAIRAARTGGVLPPEGWTPFSDDPVTDATPIRAQHMREMAAAIQQLWHQHAMGRLPAWTERRGAPPSAGTPIYASDVNDLRRWCNALEMDERPRVGQPRARIIFGSSARSSRQRPTATRAPVLAAR